MPTKVDNLVWILNEWETPATHYEEKRVGDFRLKKTEYEPGYYSHYYIDGYAFMQAMKTLPIMSLQQYRDGKWHDWMADTPMDYRCMQKYAEDSFGNVLTSGLGLGLIAHELLKNKEVEHITIVERSPEVISLVYDYIPKEKVTLVVSDFWDFVAHDKNEWDMIITDIWATKGKEAHDKAYLNEVLPANDKLRAKYPGAVHVFHGFAEVSDIVVIQPYFKRG